MGDQLDLNTSCKEREKFASQWLDGGVGGILLMLSDLEHKERIKSDHGVLVDKECNSDLVTEKES